MTQFSDARANRLQLSGFATIHDWLKSATGWVEGAPQHISDLWREFLAQRGFPGQHNSALSEYLASTGYPQPALQDQLYAFWCSVDPLPGALP